MCAQRGDTSSMSLVTAQPSTLALPATRARVYAAEARAPATRRCYAGQLRRYAEWCSARGATPGLNATVAAYLADRADAGTSIATLAQALAALGQAATAAGTVSPRTDPLVRETWAGIRRVHRVAPRRQASPLSPSDLRAMCAATAGRVDGTRDRALLLIGWAAALRRSDLVALDTEDVSETDDGLLLRIRREKTDQEGVGRTVGVPFGSDPTTCPVRALRQWPAESGIVAGPLWRSYRGRRLTRRRLGPGDVARIVQRVSSRAGLSLEHASGHSLRAGLATTAAKAGKPLHSIMAQTGHRSAAMVMRYIRDAEVFSNNAAAGVGL